MDAVKDWVRTISTVLFFSVVAEMLMPEGGMKKYARLMLGVFVVLAIVEPVVRLTGGRVMLPLPAAPLEMAPEAEDLGVQSREYERQSAALVSRAVEQGLKARLASIEGLGGTSVRVSVARDDWTGRWKVDRVSVVVPSAGAGDEDAVGGARDANGGTVSGGGAGRIEVKVPPVLLDGSVEPKGEIEGNAAVPHAEGEHIGGGDARDREEGSRKEEDLRQIILAVVEEGLGVSPENVEIHMGHAASDGR